MTKVAFHIFDIALLSIVFIVTLDKFAVNSLLTPGHLELVRAFLYSLYLLTVYKTDISPRRTLIAGSLNVSFAILPNLNKVES